MNGFNPSEVSDLENPQFLAYVRAKHHLPLTPEPQDYDPTACPVSDEEYANEYRNAQARFLMRLYREWRLTAN